MKQEAIASFLKGVTLFKGMPEDSFPEIAKKIRMQAYHAGEIIFSENTQADALYIIASGVVNVLKLGSETSASEEILTEKGAGDFFGEMSMVDELPRSATIRAKSQSVLVLRLERMEFIKLLQTYSCMAFSVARRISRTVREANERYIAGLEARNLELEEANQKLQNAQDELLTAERLSAIGKFASIIIHDIKNPLTNIRAYAELIDMKLHDVSDIPSSLLHGTSVIMSEVDRLVAMTKELLDFAKGEIRLEKQKIDFYEYLQGLVENVHGRMIKSAIQITLEKPTEKVEICLDTAKMQRVFLNLVNNAAEAIGENGTIKIQLQNDGENKVLWRIKDSGCGISEDMINRIFEPFTSGKANGTGLGMAIVKSIIEKHGGTILVKSKNGKGTEMNICLPKQ